MPMILGTNSRAYRPEKWMGTVLWAACSLAHGQSLISSLSVNSPGSVNINIEQTGAARLGTVVLDSSGSGAVSLQVTQVAGATAPASARLEVYTQGSSATRVTLRQETTSHSAVSDVSGTLLLGTSSRGTGHDVTLLQQGSEARGSLELISGNRLTAYLVQGAGSTLGITTSGSDNVFGTAAAPISLGTSSGLAITNTGDWNRFQVSLGVAAQATIINSGGGASTSPSVYNLSLAAGSSALVSNSGNFNSYQITTQQSNDSVSLYVQGSSNNFNFSLPVGSGGTYYQMAWGVAADPAVVKGGDFELMKSGANYIVYDKKNDAANQAAAASATVTPKP